MGTLRILIFANGDLPDLAAARKLPAPDDLILCADGGSHHERALGLTPDALIGDLDSIAEEELAGVEGSKTAVVRVQRDKDETDLELAVNYALERDPAFIVIVGALGGRLDHTLGNIALLADPRLIRRRCSLDDGVERVVLPGAHRDQWRPWRPRVARTLGRPRRGRADGRLALGPQRRNAVAGTLARHQQ